MYRNQTRTRWLILAGVLVSIGAFGPWSGGAENQEGTSEYKPDIGDRADRILREMGEYLSAAQKFTFHAEVTYDSMLFNDQMIQYGGRADASVRRPNGLHVEYRGDERQSSIVFDGNTFVIHDYDLNLYATTEAPPELDAAVDLIFEKYGFSVPIADFVYADPYATLTEFIETGFWVGLHSVDGTPCHHLAFTQESIDWQIWIEDGPRPVPRKLVITYKDEWGSPQYTARLSDWDFKPRLSDHDFQFKPPLDAIEIDFMSLPVDLPLEEMEIEK